MQQLRISIIINYTTLSEILKFFSFEVQRKFRSQVSDYEKEFRDLSLGKVAPCIPLDSRGIMHEEASSSRSEEAALLASCIRRVGLAILRVEDFPDDRASRLQN